MEKGKTKSKLKNYLILFGLFFACVIIVLYLCSWYRVYDQYQKETPVIRGSVQEIMSEDLEHYVLDNPYAVIYMCTASDEKCRSFEKNFKKLIEKKELTEDIIYLNLSDTDLDAFTEEFNNRYSYKTKLTTNYPAIVLFEDNKVVGLLQGNNKKELTVTRVKQFLELNEIGE